jgi:hypothetical protein
MDNERRNFLKIMLIGSGTLLAGRILGPLFSLRSDNVIAKIEEPKETDSPAKKSPSSFKVVENEKMLSIYDNYGEEIFQIDKGA